MAPSYRREIDGLRAVAVVPVMLYHAGVPGIPGGFLGVDVFFVISGFLITSLIVTALSEGRFSFWEFYARRARRLLPALAAMLIICLPLAWATMLPKAFGAFGLSMGATAIFLSNVHFWQLTGYFDGASVHEPLLHTWSLSIEEQYYLVFPLLILLLWRTAPRRIVFAAVAVLALVSLAVSQWGWSYRPDVNYFFTPSRFWELLAGSLAALLSANGRALMPQSDRLRALASQLESIGLAMILTAMVLFDDKTPHPALPTLWPVAGTMLVLLCAQHGGWATRLLSAPLCVGIGLISYSLYLWHQPVLVFSRLLHPDLAGPGAIAFQLVVTFALGWASWRFVELPFRLGRPGALANSTAPKTPLAPRPVVLMAAGVLTLLLGLGLLADKGRDLARRYVTADAAGRALLDFTVDGDGAVDRYYMHNVCFLDGSFPPDTRDRCLPASGIGGLVIWGDSHAAALAHGLRSRFSDVGQLTTSGCAPIASSADLFPEKCRRNNDDSLRLLRENPPETLLLHANWIHRAGQLPYLGPVLPGLVAALPQTRIVILGGMPQWQPSLPERIFDAGLALTPGLTLAADLTAIRVADDEIVAQISAAGLAERIELVRLTDLLCDKGICDAAFASEGKTEPLVWDYGHLTAAGALELAGRLAIPLGQKINAN
ncbi:MAG: acyltransferase [Rhodobacteraceae bacterium]|nr:acyltransferase [Paracoccaceae bacterium]